MVAKSWAKRFEQDGKRHDWNAWSNLLVLNRNPRVYFFDLERRSLRGLSSFVGKDLETDWKPLNHSDYEPKQPIIPQYKIDDAERIYRRVTHRE